MKISVIIPTYQPGAYLFECLHSLKEQSFPHDDFEVIIILNGNRYPYENSIRDYLTNDRTDIVMNYVYSDIKGVSRARNVGIENARGDYLLFLDDDDLLSDNYLQELGNCVVSDGIVVSNVKTFSNDSDRFGDDYLSKAYRCHLQTSPNAIFKLRSFLSTSCCKLIPKKIIDDRRFDTGVSIGEDSLFMFLLSDRIRSIHLSPQASAVYYRRLRPDSASRTRKSFPHRFSTSWKLIRRYTSIYFRSISTYRFTLYVSRVIAALRKITPNERLSQNQ